MNYNNVVVFLYIWLKWIVRPFPCKFYCSWDIGRSVASCLLQVLTFNFYPTCDGVFTRDSVHVCYSAYMPRQFRPSVRPSVTRVYCVKTGERIIKILAETDRPIILVFRHQGSLLKSDDFTPNGGAKLQRGSINFRPLCGYISETVINRGIVTMEDEYKVVCVLSISAAFDDLEWPRTQIQGHSEA